MNEAEFKRRLVAEVRKLPGGWARRIEDRWAVGVLDLVVKLPALPIVFCEGKVIDGNVFGPTSRQWEEGLKLQAAGIEVLLLGWKAGIMYISPWVQQADLRHCALSQHWIRGLQEYLTFNKETQK